MNNTAISIHRFPALQNLNLQGGARRIPQIQQQMETECGAACLAMVLGYFGRNVTLGEIRDLTGVGRDGLTALDVLKVARCFGLRGRGVRIELDALPFLSRGAILHWDFSHFVVFEGLRRNAVSIVDPAAGRRDVPMEEFRHSFTGVALLLEPADDFKPAAARKSVVWSYVKSVLSHSEILTRVLAMSLLLQLFATGLPVLTGLLVDRVIPSGDADLLSILAVGLAGIVLFHFLASLLRAHLLLHLRTRLDAQMTLSFLEHLVSLPYAFFQNRSAGDLMMRVNSNSTIREMIASNTLSSLLDGPLAVFYLLALLIASPSMGTLVFALGVLEAAIFLLSYRKHRELNSSGLQAQAKAQGYLMQMLNGIETLKAGGVENRAVEQWSNLFVDELNVSLSRGRLTAATDSLLGALRVGSPLTVLLYGGHQVLTGQLNLGTMLALSALAAGFLGPIATVISTGLELQLLRSYVERIDDILKAEPEQARSQSIRAERFAGAVELQDVSFSHGPLARGGLGNISVSIRPGQKVAIVGRSGAGKSTLAKLLVGLYRPAEGRILFDGRDLFSQDLQAVRRQIGIVTQRSYLFSTSIRNNIALSDPALSLEDVTRAAEMACIHDDIAAMPMGYETLLADGGGSISGGQRQRIALARALVERPAILLLDEATSELDTVTEARVHQNIGSLHCTRIVVAHRLSTVVDADMILVMENGTIIERGTHKELLDRNGNYAGLIAAQTLSA